MSIARAAGLGCLLLLSPALCFSAYADDDITSADTDPYLIKGTVDTAKGTMTATGKTSSEAVQKSSDGKMYSNIYGANSQTVTTSFPRIDNIHTTVASHNDITFTGWLKSYYLVGAISEPSAYDSTGNARATADYNIVRVIGADSFVNFGGVAFAGVNGEDDHHDGDSGDQDGSHDGNNDGQGGNTGDNTDNTGGNTGGNTDNPGEETDEGTASGGGTQEDTAGGSTEGSGNGGDTDDAGGTIEGNNADSQTNSLTNALSNSANALNDTAIATVSEGTATHTITVSASHNTLDITGGSQAVAVAGIAAVGETLEENGSSASATLSADYNTLILRGGTYNLDKSVGTGDSDDDDEDDDGFGPFGIAGGGLMLEGDNIKLGTLSASNNTVVLAAGPDGKAPEFIGNIVLRGSTVIGDTTGCTSLDMRGNTLVTDNVKGVTAYNLENFSNYEFRLPEMKAEETVLTLTDPDGTSLKGGTLTSGNTVTEDKLTFKVTRVASLYGADGGEFKVGDKVYLVKNEKGLAVTDGYTTSVTGHTGVSVKYEMELRKDDKSLYLIRTGNRSVVDSGTKAIAEGAAAGSALINAGSDAVIFAISSMSSAMNNAQAGGSSSASSLGGASSSASSGNGASGGDVSGRNSSGMDSASKDGFGRDGRDGSDSSDGNGNGSARDAGNTYGNIFAFGYAQGSSVRHETGSSVNVSAVSLVAGLGKGFDTGAGKLAVGAFFEYGKGSYTTNNSFDDRADIDGDGNAWYMGGGLMARMDFVPTGPGHFYVEGSAHMGTLHNEYDSNDLVDASGRVAKFDMDSPYYTLHGGLGYVWNFAEGHDLDLYGKYIWSRVQGTDDSLTTKDKFEYDDMDSNRIRLGVRYSYAGNARFSPYIGAAFEHEFSGSCDSRAYGHPVASPSFEGSSGMGELGLVMRPSASVPLSLNLGVQGYVGQKQGISGNCTMMYEF